MDKDPSSTTSTSSATSTPYLLINFTKAAFRSVLPAPAVFKVLVDALKKKDQVCFHKTGSESFEYRLNKIQSRYQDSIKAKSGHTPYSSDHAAFALFCSEISEKDFNIAINVKGYDDIIDAFELRQPIDAAQTSNTTDSNHNGNQQRSNGKSSSLPIDPSRINAESFDDGEDVGNRSNDSKSESNPIFDGDGDLQMNHGGSESNGLNQKKRQLEEQDVSAEPSNKKRKRNSDEKQQHDDDGFEQTPINVQDYVASWFGEWNPRDERCQTVGRFYQSLLAQSRTMITDLVQKRITVRQQAASSAPDGFDPAEVLSAEIHTVKERTIKAMIHYGVPDNDYFESIALLIGHQSTPQHLNRPVSFK